MAAISGPSKRVYIRRRIVVAGIVAAAAAGGVFLLVRGGEPPKPWEVRGSEAWARRFWGNADATKFRKKNIVEIDFLGEPMYVHEKVAPHFRRLAAIFRDHAPEYAVRIDVSPDDWSYNNRDIRGDDSKSTHAFGIALDINALTNVLGTQGDMPESVVRRWEQEGGEWGGDWSRPDPMHFESRLTPAEIAERYAADGTPR